MRTLRTLSAETPGSPAKSRPGGGRLARVRRAAEELTPQAIEQIAQRVVQLLHGQSPGPAGADPSVKLLSASEVARRLGVTRAWVYEHAEELGARRLGDGPKARLRFDRDAVEAAAPAMSPRAPRRPREAAAEVVAPATSRRRRPKPPKSTAGSVLVVRSRRWRS